MAKDVNVYAHMLFAYVELSLAYACNEMFGTSVEAGDQGGRRKEEGGRKKETVQCTVLEVHVSRL